MSTVLVTPRSFGRDDPALRRSLEEAVGEVRWAQGVRTEPELAALLDGVDGWIAGLEEIGPTLLDRADGRLKVIARFGVGVDNIDLEGAARRGIVVTNTPGANAGAVAELVLGLMIALARHIPAADRAVRAGDWSAPRGLSLEGKVLGLLGLGAVGRALAARVANLGMELIAHDVRLAPGELDHGARAVALEELLARSDYVSLHLPLTDRTRGLLDAGRLAAMKPGAFLVNAARGELLDEAALVDALRSGAIAGAALDALSIEPPPAGFALAEMDNVILTPHLGAQTDHAHRAMARRALSNCLAVLRGGAPPDPVPAEIGAAA